MKNSRIPTILDNIIFVFIALFLVTLQNSIFLNQIGYYGALVLMLIKWAYFKKSPFQKTGLEWIFLLFLMAEIFSTIFSVDTDVAFNNLLKRILLIPIVYVIFTAAETKQKVITFFKIYIVAGFITLLIYIIFVYQHFIQHLYELQAKGPSPFQYVMTAGGLISFLVIFSMAFLLNEKSTLKIRSIFLAGFLISIFALTASYTRAAWIGTAAGILVLLILKRKWIIIGIAAILILGLYLTQSNRTVFYILDKERAATHSLEFSGKLNSIYSGEDGIFFAAYEKGIVRLDDSVFVPVINTRAPVDYFSKWKDDLYLAILVDQRMDIYIKENDKFKRVNELLSPGFTASFQLIKDFLYVADLDSGITIFTDPLNSEKMLRYPGITKVRRLAVGSDHASFCTDDSLLYIYDLKDGLLNNLIYTENFGTKFGFMTFYNNYLIMSTENHSRLFKIEGTSVVEMDLNEELKQVTIIGTLENKIYLAGFRDILYEISLPQNDMLEIIERKKLPFTPTSVTGNDKNYYLAHLDISRLNSIIDPYHTTNIQRLHQWSAGWEILKDHLVFGVGDIDMKETYNKYKKYYEKDTYGHLHNNYVQILAALGLFGFIIVILLLFKIFMTHLAIYKSVRDLPFASSYALGAIGTFVAFLVSGLAEWNFGDHEIITMIWFVLGLNLALRESFKMSEEKTTKQEITIE